MKGGFEMTNKLYSKIDRDIDSIIDARFFLYDDNTFKHRPLCAVFILGEYRELWKDYWNKFNTKNHIIVTDYIKFSYDNDVIISALTRLLIVEDFKLYCYHKMKKRK